MRSLFHWTAAALCTFLPLHCFAEVVTPLGVLYLGEETSVELPFSNSGKASLTVQSAGTSCECLTPQFPATQIAPGETKLLHFVYRPVKAGHMRVDITYVVPSSDAALTRESVTGIVAEKSWAVVPTDLKAEMGADVVLVDLRRSERFQSAHIPRSLTVPIFALKLHAELKTRNVVLVDEGFSPAALADEILRLREAGFSKVRFLDGGIASWIRAGGIIEGNNKSILDAALVTAADFVRSQHIEPWTVVHVRGSGKTDEDVSVSTNTSRVLVVAASESDYARYEREHSTKPVAPTFYLSGGEAALAVYKTEQTRMASNPGAVFQSKSLQPHVVANTGCGTCPKRP